VSWQKSRQEFGSTDTNPTQNDMLRSSGIIFFRGIMSKKIPFVVQRWFYISYLTVCGLSRHPEFDQNRPKMMAYRYVLTKVLTRFRFDRYESHTKFYAEIIGNNIFSGNNVETNPVRCTTVVWDLDPHRVWFVKTPWIRPKTAKRDGIRMCLDKSPDKNSARQIQIRGNIFCWDHWK
jgi:hypothetical protein